MTKFTDLMQQYISGEAPPPPVAQLLGYRLVEFAPGRAVIRFPTGPQHANPMGTIQGGILSNVADAAMGLANSSTLHEGESYTTLELKINFLRAVRNATLVVTGVVVRRGRTISFVECEIVDEEGRLVAKASATHLTLRGENAEVR